MRIPWITACCMLIGCAAQAPGPDPSQSQSQNETAPAPSPALAAESREAAAETEASDTATAATSVDQVAIESFADVATCRRYVATGTRIAGKRCASNEETPADRLEYEQTRRDVEAMRTQQIYQEQARQRAIEEEMRRRTGQ